MYAKGESGPWISVCTVPGETRRDQRQYVIPPEMSTSDPVNMLLFRVWGNDTETL